jgi:hypothetical protein
MAQTVRLRTKISVAAAVAVIGVSLGDWRIDFILDN